jgi:hypothetical protein
MLATGADSNGRDRSLFTWRDRVQAEVVPWSGLEADRPGAELFYLIHYK